MPSERKLIYRWQSANYEDCLYRQGNNLIVVTDVGKSAKQIIVKCSKPIEVRNYVEALYIMFGEVLHRAESDDVKPREFSELSPEDQQTVLSFTSTFELSKIIPYILIDNIIGQQKKEQCR